MKTYILLERSYSTLSNIKRMIKNVLAKVEKKELKNKIIESKIYRIKKAMEGIK